MKYNFDELFVKNNRKPIVIAGLRAGNYLAREIYEHYVQYSPGSVIFLENIDESFSDTEIRVRIQQSISGKHIYIIQSFFNPLHPFSVNDNLMSFFMAVRAMREHGAKSITGITSYLGYSRQDKPTEYQREATTARLVADLMITAGIDRIACLEPHSPQIHGFFASVPLMNLSSVPIWREVFKDIHSSSDTIIVAPDIGAAKTVKNIAKSLNLPMAVASKFRPSKEKVEIMEIVGDFTGKTKAIIIDDIISTGSTIYAVAQMLHETKGILAIDIAATHLLGVDNCCNNFKKLTDSYGLDRIYTTNSIPLSCELSGIGVVNVINLAEMYTLVINRMFNNESVSSMFNIATVS
ncbi:MAG: ribose-phosphate pyrophosphokinase [Candidatus Marinimicrobia bacterium]|nr:ribose-phosphate pyrophosphokinase [Candidatus Neomarinimicrobiota bacterium]